MQLRHTGIAGTLESGDIFVEVEAADAGISIDLDSSVGNQFGRQIKRVIAETLQDCGVENAAVRAVDKGALDCTIRARVAAAAHRGADSEAYEWR